MENKSIEVKSLTFIVGDKEIVLTPFEAKQFQSVLNNLFEKEFIVQKEYIPYPYQPVTIQPYITNPWYVTCQGTSGGGNSLAFNTSDSTVKCMVNV